MDVLLVGFIGAMVAGGYRTGLLHRLAGLGFMALSFVLGAYLRGPAGGLITLFFKNVPQSYAEMVGYAIAFPVIVAGANLLAHPLLSREPVGGLSRDADRILGGILGGIEAILIISAAIVILDTYFGTKALPPRGAGLDFLTSFRDSLAASTTAHLLRDTTVPLVLTILGPLLPTDIRSVVPGLPSVPGLPGGLPLPTP